ncbi:MAG: hypothetical protein GY932_09880 [Arcobacter sp.]|nr:hypothetical protein [Arcobacter sp.]
MKKKFNVRDFDEIQFINSGNETEELINAKEYLKDIQMTVNIGDLNESLFTIEDINNIKEEEKRVIKDFKESIFSIHSLSFLEKVKLLTSFEGINPKALQDADFGSKDNFAYLNQNLINHCKEFITAIWDCILIIKISHANNRKSILVDELNDFFENLTKIKTGNSSAYIKKDNSLDMICELVLFMQYYIPDFFIFLIKSKSVISSLKNLKSVNKDFTNILKKSNKIMHRLQMLEQIKSNNYQLLLKLLIEQKNSEI